MDDVGSLIKIIGEVLIGVLAALATAWAAMRQTRLPEEVKQSVGTMVDDLSREREELLTLLRQQRQDNLELQREIGELTRMRSQPSGSQ